MRYKKMSTIGTLLAVLMLAIAVAVLPVGAVPTGDGSVGTNTSYTGTASSDTAQGGNITVVDFDTIDSQTSQWQGYYGTVTGEIVLSNSGGAKLFNWTWTTSNGGEVFAARSEMAYADWTALVTVTGAPTEINNDFSMTGSDTATGLFDTESSAIIVAGDNIGAKSVAAAMTNNNTGSQVWETIALASSATPSAVTDYVFAGVIDKGGEAFDGTTKDFQMIVPVEDDTTPTYYFYVELT